MLKYILSSLSMLLVAATSFADNLDGSPLAAYSPIYNSDPYKACNTAAKASYLSAAEKQVIYILNLVRLNPPLFAETVLKTYPEKIRRPGLRQSDYYKSLVSTLQKMEPATLLKPDLICWASAECHATSSGKTGYVGHERQTAECKSVKNFYGECCDYSMGKPLDIVLQLLIDEDIPSLGHRHILLGNFSRIGVSTKPHSVYGMNTVLDLR